MQYDNAIKVYPELAILGTSGENLKTKIPLELQTKIEKGIQQIENKYPTTKVFGTICMFSTEINRDPYARLHQTLTIAPGCYRVAINASNTAKNSTCKIVGRSCENTNTLNSCDDVDPDNQDGGGSNPNIFLNYLVQENKKGNNITLEITAELNNKLTNKLTDEASIIAIMAKESDVLIVYSKQINAYVDINDCSVVGQNYGNVGCDASLIMYDKDSANNMFLRTPSVFAVLRDQYNLLHLLLDLSNITNINILGLDENGNKINDNNTKIVWIWLIVGIVILIIIIGIILFLTTKSNKKNTFTDNNQNNSRNN
jgi:hypothetical protein